MTVPRSAGFYVSLLILVIASSALSLMDAGSGPVMRFGWPVLVILSVALLVLGRVWARWLILALDLGA